MLTRRTPIYQPQHIRRLPLFEHLDAREFDRRDYFVPSPARDGICSWRIIHLQLWIYV
jgi:hypothetical protein